VILLVVDNPRRWRLSIPGVEVVAARSYLLAGGAGRARGTLVFNLCRSYGYQRIGYYVSLLAEARGQRCKPSIETIQEMRSKAVVRVASSDLSAQIQRALSRLRTAEFVLSVYFGRSLAKRHQPLATALFNQFQAPLLRARFQRRRGAWELAGIGPIPAGEIPETHHEFVVEAAQAYFARRRWSPPRSRSPRCTLAILHDPQEKLAPSDPKALRRFVRVGRRLGIASELITRQDYSRVAEFDALFIRTTTFVHHYTYRFASRAKAGGLVVIDDPRSIVRCTNKVFLAEMLERSDIPAPRTMLVHRDNVESVQAELGLPCVLKEPDGSFSTGVTRATNEAELREGLERLLAQSELVVAQEFLPTDYDWRVGVLDGRALYACRYFMSRGHWQVINHGASGPSASGRVETLAVEDVPRKVIDTALAASRLMGDGLYGVDLKEVGGRVLVIEVNENPNIEVGYEDRVLKDELYERILRFFLERVEARRAATS